MRYVLYVVKDANLAEDAVQESFLRYYECRLKGEPIPKPRAWIFRVARNYAIDQIRAAHSGRLVELEDAACFADDRYSPENELDRVEARTLISRLLAPRELECLRLWSYGFKYREIAAILDIEPNTVGATLARGLRKIHTACVRKGDCQCERDSTKS